MKYTIKVFRFDPDKDKKMGRFETYEIEGNPFDRVLDALHYIQEKDSTLAFRRSCGHGMCGSDGMTINNRSALACKVLLKDLKQPIVVEPLRGFRVIRDLIVDMEPFFENIKKVKPYLVSKSEPRGTEFLQSPKDFKRMGNSPNCILCGCCYSSCPSFWGDEKFIGPAAFVKAFRYITDSRDSASEERLKIISGRHGLPRCHTIINCTEACPKDIDITGAISALKKQSASQILF